MKTVNHAKRTSKKPIVSRFLVGVTLLCSSSFAVQAETLTLQEAISKTLKSHPELRRFAHQNSAAQAMIQQAAAPTPMQANIMMENALGTGSQASFKAAQTTLSLSWLLEDKVLDSRKQVATTQANQVDVEQRIQAIDLAAETAGYFITLLAQEEELKLAKQAERQAQHMLLEITERVNAAQTNPVDQLRAKANLSGKTLVVEDLVHEIEATKAQLVAQWQGDLNESALDELRAIGRLGQLPHLPTLDALAEQLQQHPRLQWYATQQRIAQSQINLAKITAQPAWRVTVGARRTEELDDYSMMASLSIPFGGEDRNDGQIRALNAQQNQQQAQADAWQQRMYTQLLLLTHKLKHNLHVIEGLQREIIPALESANQQAMAAYQQGSYRYSDWYDVQQDLLNAKQQLITAYTNMQQFSVERERLTGTSAVSSAASPLVQQPNSQVK